MKFPPTDPLTGYALSALLAANVALGAQETLLEPAAMRADLQQLRELVQQRWAYVDDKRENFGVDLQQLIDAAIARAAQPMPKSGFGALLWELGAALQDGHAAVHTPNFSLLQQTRWLVRLRDTADGLVVTATKDPRWKVGDVVRELDGQPIEDLLAARARLVPASTPGARRALAVAGLTAIPEPPGEPIAWRRLRADVGLLRIAHFKAPDWEAWSKAKVEERDGLIAATKVILDRAFAELADARWLVIDLRGNQGGTDLLGIHVAEKLVPKPFRYFELEPRAEDGKYGRRSWLTYGRDEKRVVFAGRVVVLIDELVFSAADNFAACVADRVPGIQLVGRPTHGGTGAPRLVGTLAHSGAEVFLTTHRVYRPEGGLIEGRGTQPTVPVRWTRRHVVENLDADLEAALALCR